MFLFTSHSCCEINEMSKIYEMNTKFQKDYPWKWNGYFCHCLQGVLAQATWYRCLCWTHSSPWWLLGLMPNLICSVCQATISWTNATHRPGPCVEMVAECLNLPKLFRGTVSNFTTTTEANLNCKCWGKKAGHNVSIFCVFVNIVLCTPIDPLYSCHFYSVSELLWSSTCCSTQFVH